MLKLKCHANKIGEFSEIDKIILIPKKISDEFEVGEDEYSLDGQKMRLRIYDIPCNCSQKMHTHRIIDLREVWEKLNLSDGQEVEIGK